MSLELFPIGGYFELELPKVIEYHKQAIRLNTGRNAFEYILSTHAISKVYLPKFICSSMHEPLKKLNLEFEEYSIDENFYPILGFKQIKSTEYFLYVNYFGINDVNVEVLKSRVKNLIVDNSQAFYSKPVLNCPTLYSPRKFFGIPDGAYLYCDKDLQVEKDVSNGRFEALIGRLEFPPEDFYNQFKESSKKLSGQDIKEMSKATQRMLESINYAEAKTQRISNFECLQKRFEKINNIDIKLNKSSVPMGYPLLISNGKRLKSFLISNKVFVPTYWPEILDTIGDQCFERNLVENLVFIPIDQRYNASHMNEIIRLTNTFLNNE